MNYAVGAAGKRYFLLDKQLGKEKSQFVPKTLLTIIKSEKCESDSHVEGSVAWNIKCMFCFNMLICYVTSK